MKNFNGTPLEINQIQGVDFLGYELIDKENGIRYELVNEPWVSLAAAARATGRKTAVKDVEVLVTSNWPDSLITENVPNADSIYRVTSFEALLEYIYSIDYNGFSLIIYNAAGIPIGDWTIDSNLLRQCKQVKLHFVSKDVTTDVGQDQDLVDRY